MRESILYLGIYEGAFANRLKTLVRNGHVDGEVVTEVWYQLSLEDAKRFIKNDESTELNIEEGNELPDSWIKLVTTEHKNTVTGETRHYWSTSLRPYVQGYGCDGKTDLNIHAIANRLAEKHGLDYRSLLARAYPGEFSLSDDFSWLKDDVVMAETTIPDEIDPDLALRDLEQINNYTLAMEFGIELYRLGAISTNWEEIRKNLDVMKKKIQQDVSEWFSNKAAN
jgi:hypothetical protein